MVYCPTVSLFCSPYIVCVAYISTVKEFLGNSVEWKGVRGERGREREWRGGRGSGGGERGGGRGSGGEGEGEGGDGKVKRICDKGAQEVERGVGAAE